MEQWRNKLVDRVFAPEVEVEVFEPISDDSLTYLQSIYRDPSATRGERMRAAVAALPFERPKLAVIGMLPERDFAARLEALRKRSARPQLIERLPSKDF